MPLVALRVFGHRNKRGLQICGSEGWGEIEDFGHSKLDFLRQSGNFTGGIPSHDTFVRVRALINADQLQTAFAEWMKGVP